MMSREVFVCNPTYMICFSSLIDEMRAPERRDSHARLPGSPASAHRPKYPFPSSGNTMEFSGWFDR